MKGQTMLEIKFTTNYPPTTEEEVQKLEETLGIKLPEDYRDFLLTYNGGHAPENGLCMFYENNKGADTYVNELFGINTSYSAINPLEDFEFYPYDDLLEIGIDDFGNIFCLGIKYGKVFFYDLDGALVIRADRDEKYSPPWIADSFYEFIENLEKNDYLGE
jgi:hypothetical protein